MVIFLLNLTNVPHPQLTWLLHERVKFAFVGGGCEHLLEHIGKSDLVSFVIGSILKKIYDELSRGEICVANIIPPVNGVSLGSFFAQNSSKVRLG